MSTFPPGKIICPFCSSEVDALAFYCPICGKNIREKPLSTGVFMQLWIYFVSFFLPPFGLGLTIKYLKAKDDKVRIVGFISLGLTIVALVLAVALSLSFLKTVNQLIPKELNQFDTIGL